MLEHTQSAADADPSASGTVAHPEATRTTVQIPRLRRRRQTRQRQRCAHPHQGRPTLAIRARLRPHETSMARIKAHRPRVSPQYLDAFSKPPKSRGNSVGRSRSGYSLPLRVFLGFLVCWCRFSPKSVCFQRFSPIFVQRNVLREQVFRLRSPKWQTTATYLTGGFCAAWALRMPGAFRLVVWRNTTGGCHA